LDVLTGIDPLKICVAYRYEGKTIREFPASLDVLAKCEPVYEELPGWHEDITGAKTLDDLPENARHYLNSVSELCEIPLAIFSVVPDRTQTYVIKHIKSIDWKNDSTDRSSFARRKF